MIYTKKCNTCDKEVQYINHCSFRSALRNNTDCKKCSALKRDPKSEETRQKISKSLFGRIVPSDVRMKIKSTMIRIGNTPEWKQKCSLHFKGKNNGMYGHHHSEEIKKKISDNTKKAMHSYEVENKMNKIWSSTAFKEKISKIHKGKIVSNEVKKKMRISAAKRIEKYGIHSRNYNPDACKIIDEYGKQNGYNFQHALNGGEHRVDGYFVDGYDKDKNVVIEIDEKPHFDFNGNLKEKDIRRQKEIEEYLKCKFVRLRI
jgi:hypothetical protein